MTIRKLSASALLALLVHLHPAPALAQTVEIVGSRALGMGGAFVGVANDSSATWWNPAGLAAGPFLDLALSRTLTEVSEGLPARRARVSAFALGTPPLGLAYYRYRLTDATPLASTASSSASREGDQTDVPVRSLVVSQFSATVLQSVLPGVHLGTTLKYLRGTSYLTTGSGQGSASGLLDTGEDLSGGKTEGQFDLDAGIMAVGGPLQLGAVVRNLHEPEFGTKADGTGPEFRLPRQFRFGAGFDAQKVGSIPLTLAFDADVRRYTAASGERRVIAIGAEQWLLSHRLALRGGARWNRVGAMERAATGGVSVAVRSGMYLDAHIVGGGSADERGWGAAARVSF